MRSNWPSQRTAHARLWDCLNVVSTCLTASWRSPNGPKARARTAHGKKCWRTSSQTPLYVFILLTQAPCPSPYPQCAYQADEGSRLCGRVPLRATICASRAPRVSPAALARNSIYFPPSGRCVHCPYTRRASYRSRLVPAPISSGGALRRPRSIGRVGANPQRRRAMVRSCTYRGSCASYGTRQGACGAAFRALFRAPTWLDPP